MSATPMSTSEMAEPSARAREASGPRARHAALAAAALLLVVYAATLAPTVTFWDAGEFLAAIHTLGIPHPPGTPLFVLAANAWTHLVPWAPVAPMVNLFSALCATSAGAIVAWLLARWTGWPVAAIAAAVMAGTGSSVWLNATETEVYSASLALSALMLLVAWRRAERDDARWSVVLAYLFALAVPLHLSALVAAPAAIVLAVSLVPRDRALREAGVLGAALLVVAAAGTVRPWQLVAGAAALGVALAFWRGAGGRTRALVPVALLIGLSPLAAMLVRASHDPAIDQGDPATWQSLLYVVGRRQYAVAPMWPRQAPPWLQLGNLVQWADWQWGLGLSAWVGASWTRTPVTIAVGALGIAGARAHRSLHRPSWRAWLVLLLSGTLGVLAYLNLKAGPSYGWGILPEGAPHEARERDYFFALGFWAWGAWAGLGAAVVGQWAARRVRRGAHAGIAAVAALAIALLPTALNWRGVSRREPVEAEAPRAVAHALLDRLPRDAVLLVAGDNDSYPLWYLQQVEDVRRDVAVVTLPLLGAPWYRAEVARRYRLLPDSLVVSWPGTTRLAQGIAARAVALRRPLAAAATVEAALRDAIGGAWVLRGATYERVAADVEAARPPAVDTAAARAALAALPGPLRAVVDGAVAADSLRPPPGLRESTDPTTAQMIRLLACPRAALGAGTDARAAGFLDSRCNYK